MKTDVQAWSFSERSDAGSEAWASPGISQVNNQLQMTTEELILLHFSFS